MNSHEIERGNKMSDNDTYQVTGDALLQYIEQYEQLDVEKKSVTERQKEVMAEAKANGFDTKAMKAIISLRAKDKDTIAEEEAILDAYKAALNMN